jgi:uncharacterized glyoxalase superfamily protein PhnB
MATKTTSNIIPTLRYRNAPAAIDFLCAAFGFERHAIHEGPRNLIAHAQLVLGGGMIMLSSATNEGEYSNWVRPPDSSTAPNTQGTYVVVADCDAHCARARKEGATILEGPEDRDYGGRGYSCRDLEGHVWSFGTYDPWAPAGK